MLNMAAIQTFRGTGGNQNYDKSTVHLPRQVSWIGKHPFAKWGNIGHNKAEELNDTTDFTTKGARLDA